jgi:hypothetical protein
MPARGVSPPVMHAGTPGWITRVRKPSFTSASSVRIKFDFEDVSREIELRRAAFQFPGVNGVYIQRNGSGQRSYPLRCIFSGATHDLEATAFEEALLEDGTGTLEHPFYGTIRNVVAMGSIKRRDDLKSAANQTIVEVDFWPTLRAIYPTNQADPTSEITAALEGFNVAAAQGFAAVTDLDTLTKQAGLTDSIRKFLREISSVLGTVSDATASVNREFRDIESTINYGIDVFVGQPLVLAQQLVDLTTAPSRALAGIESRLDGYGLLAERIMTSAAGSPVAALLPSVVLGERTSTITNAFHGADLVAMAAVAGAASSCVHTTFSLRPDALNAALALLDLFDAVVDWRDAAFAAFAAEYDGEYLPINQLDPGGAYQALLYLVSLLAGHLIRVSFTLIPERRIVLGRNRTIIDLAAELYGAVDSRLDELINANNLTGDEILELPAGREIAYYPTLAAA